MGSIVFEDAVGIMAPCCAVTVEVALSVVDVTDGLGTAVDSIMASSLLQAVAGNCGVLVEAGVG